MTLADLIPDVRNLVNDSSASGHRWPDGRVVGFLCDAITLLGQMRPESRYVGGLLTDYDFGAAPEDFEVPSELVRWKSGFVYFAAGKCLEEDVTDTSNATLAADFISKATSRFQL